MQARAIWAGILSGWLMFVAPAFVQRAHAEEQAFGPEDRGALPVPGYEVSLSAATRDEQSTPKKKKKKKNGWALDHQLTFAQGLHPQDDKAPQPVPSATSSGLTIGYYGDASASVLHTDGDRKLSLSAEYTHDPFTLRTFAFDPEEQLDRTARIIQRTDTLRADFVWRKRLLPALRSVLLARGGVQFAEGGTFDSQDARARYDLRMGALSGIRGLISFEGGILLYPNYLLNNRHLDQGLFGTEASVGYRWGRLMLVELGYQVAYTPYLDSRYDMLDSGSVVPATKSKSHINHRLEAGVVIEPMKRMQIDIVYRFERNDSRNYSRDITGNLPDMTPDPRFISDYYDFTRHRVGLLFDWQPVPKFRAKVGGAIWKRVFDSYEARDFNNIWLGETRHDEHLGIDYEMGYRVWRAGSRKDAFNAGLWIVAFGAYDRRISNMARDISFATNYEVARLYFGLQLENL